jgi:hypothetical protein
MVNALTLNLPQQAQTINKTVRMSSGISEVDRLKVRPTENSFA